MAAATDIPGGAAILAGVDTPVDVAIPAAMATPADALIQVVTATMVGMATTVDMATMADEATMGVAMTADEAGATITGTVAVSASDTTPRLTPMILAIITSRIIAIPTATTINGATGILRPLAVTTTRTVINRSR